jgi:DNA polymerase III epsilon subunit-like protein
MNLVIDTETTGLSKDSRLVSICWLLTKGDNIIEQSYFIIKPEDWEIPARSTEIHGITKEFAIENGENIKMVLESFYNNIKRCTNIVAHNIRFDEAIIKSELLRYGYTNVIEEMDKKNKICTMLKGKTFMNLRKFPKLSELYKFLYKEEITNAHCALDDAKNCFKCFIKVVPLNFLEKESIVYFEDKKVKVFCEEKQETYNIFTKIKFLLEIFLYMVIIIILFKIINK